MNYQDFIAMVNNTLFDLWGQSGTTGPLSQALPFIEFDPTAYTSVLNVPLASFIVGCDIYISTQE